MITRRECLLGLGALPLVSILPEIKKEEKSIYHIVSKTLNIYYAKYKKVPIWQYINSNGIMRGTSIRTNKYYLNFKDFKFEERYLPKLPPQKQYSCTFNGWWFPLESLDKLDLTKNQDKFPQQIYFLEHKNHCNIVVIR